MADSFCETFHTIVIGGGQAGLSVGYHLARQGRRFLILDASLRVGDSWRRRWDSLRLFTPAAFDGLVGMRFPAPSFSFPTKNEMADYLESYAERFQLPVRNGVRVDRLSRVGSRYLIEAGPHRFEADHVVVAMSSYQVPRVPGFLIHVSGKRFRAGLPHKEGYPAGVSKNQRPYAAEPLIVCPRS